MPIFAGPAKVWEFTKTDHSLIRRFLSFRHRKILNTNLRLKPACQVLILKEEPWVSNSEIQDNEELGEPSLLFSFSYVKDKKRDEKVKNLNLYSSLPG